MTNQLGRFALEWVLPQEPGLTTHVTLYDAERHPHHALAVGHGGDEADALLDLWTTLIDRSAPAEAIAHVAAAYIPMRLLRIPEPFDSPDFIFEPKLDGFRALAHVRGHHCELVSRNGHTFKQWPQLAEEIAHAVRGHSCVLDGEVCCLDPDGRSNFKNLLFRREWPHFYASDVLSIDGKDLTGLPLLERKRRLVRHAENRDAGAVPRSHPGAWLRSVSRGLRA